MPDEEQFTFVDRRRTAAEDPPPADAPDPALSPADAPDIADALPGEEEFAQTDDTSGYDGENGGQPAIDVYSLLAYCVSLLEAQAWQCLGLIADPQTGQAQPDMAQAKVAIDAVGDLAKHLDAAPAEAVPDDLRRDLRTLVSNLRLNYVGQQGRAQ